VLVVALAAESESKVIALAATNAAARDRGLSAREVLGQVLAPVGGRGGGKDDVAQGGGTDPQGIAAAMAAVDPAIALAGA
jgi:alanyl-tRNA synthetase